MSGPGGPVTGAAGTRGTSGTTSPGSPFGSRGPRAFAVRRSAPTDRGRVTGRHPAPTHEAPAATSPRERERAQQWLDMGSAPARVAPPAWPPPRTARARGPARPARVGPVGRRTARGSDRSNRRVDRAAGAAGGTPAGRTASRTARARASTPDARRSTATSSAWRARVSAWPASPRDAHRRAQSTRVSATSNRAPACWWRATASSNHRWACSSSPAVAATRARAWAVTGPGTNTSVNRSVHGRSRSASVAAGSTWLEAGGDEGQVDECRRQPGLAPAAGTRWRRSG